MITSKPYMAIDEHGRIRGIGLFRKGPRGGRKDPLWLQPYRQRISSYDFDRFKWIPCKVIEWHEKESQ